MRVSPETARRLRWLPNALTVLRLLALPVIVWMLAEATGPTDALAAWTFAAVAVTDFIDGRLARALDAESTFGRLADPFADRMLVAVGLIGLVAIGRMGPVGPLIILLRDAAVIVGVVLMRNRGLDVRVDTFGKLSSFLVMAAVALALLSEATWIDWLFWIAVILSVATFANYLRTVANTLRGRGSSTQS
jgi:CDP-diacylglycerol--glycerol-3-phosphate 3-phosphatidyltransferase